MNHSRANQFPLLCAAGIAAFCLAACSGQNAPSPRERISINTDWRFAKGDPPGDATSLLYDVRPQPAGRRGGPPPTPPAGNASLAKPWILPSGNDFVTDPARRATRPAGNFGDGVAYVSPTFDDSAWRKLDLPHDYAIEGPFTTNGGGMGRLPAAGAAWYRKNLTLPSSDAGKSIFLDIDGAMAYSEIWLNGQFVGGWPYGYASFRLDLTPFVRTGDNTLAIRLDNPPNSSRWYAGGGLYRNVWLVKTSPVHVGPWGTYITTPEVSQTAATVALEVTVKNDAPQDAIVRVATEIFELDAQDRRIGRAVARIAPAELRIAGNQSATTKGSTTVANPKLWGVSPHQTPHRYITVTTIEQHGKTLDIYETPFGIRTLKFDPNAGLFVNGEHVKIQGVNNHSDLGALGAAVNVRALQRQLEILAEMGCNAIRTSHNPPAPELLDLADKMGFLIMDEAFDVWARQKTPFDHHLFFADWHEQDLRAMIHRDRNHPSVFMWSIGNEVGEQTTGPAGAEIARQLTAICHEEDPTRPTIAGMNSAKPDQPFSAPIDAIGLNYQGAGLNPVKRPLGIPQYPLYHQAFPAKFIVGTETASTLSSRGFYTFPIAQDGGISAAPNDGVQPGLRHVSSYDLYFADWSYFPDKEFAALDRWPYIGGEFVWTGFDYLGEPTPFDASRSSYFGIIDLAGFKKDRFYLYQARWRPELPMAHILPHWTWPERAGQVTPVHVYTSGDEAELFLNGKSLGRKKKADLQYRLRWDEAVYEPGELHVVAYKQGKQWATESVKTAGTAVKLNLAPDRATISSDGRDLSFITLTVADQAGQLVPRSMNPIQFEITGPGEIIATDNGDPTDMTAFPSARRNAFNGLALAIIRAKRGQSGAITLTATSGGLAPAKTVITAK